MRSSRFILIVAILAVSIVLMTGCTSNDVTRERHGDGSCTMVNREKVFGFTVNTDRAIVGCAEDG